MGFVQRRGREACSTGGDQFDPAALDPVVEGPRWSLDGGARIRRMSWKAWMSGPEQDAAAARARDLELVRRCLAKDAVAIHELAARLACVPRILYSINHRIGRPLGDDDLADLSQDAVVVIWSKLATFQGRGRLETWAYRFCFLEYMNRIRLHERRDRRIAPIESLDSLEERSAELGPGEVPSEFEWLERGLDELGPPESDVIRAKHFDDRTFEEIASEMNAASSTVKSQYYRGIEWLRRSIESRRRKEDR